MAFLTMERLRQPLAAGGIGFGLFSPFSRARDLRVIATDCNHGLHKGSILSCQRRRQQPRLRSSSHAHAERQDVRPAER